MVNALAILKQDIKYLPNVGPKKKTILADSIGINTYGDLLEYYPYKYVDRSRIYTVREMTGDMPYVQAVGRILSWDVYEMGPRKQRYVAHFSDGTGVMDLVWFNGGKYARQTYKTGEEYVIFGKPSAFGGRINIQDNSLIHQSPRPSTPSGAFRSTLWPALISQASP